MTREASASCFASRASSAETSTRHTPGSPSSRSASKRRLLPAPRTRACGRFHLHVARLSIRRRPAHESSRSIRRSVATRSPPSIALVEALERTAPTRAQFGAIDVVADGRVANAASRSGLWKAWPLPRRRARRIAAAACISRIVAFVPSPGKQATPRIGRSLTGAPADLQGVDNTFSNPSTNATARSRDPIGLCKHTNDPNP